MNSLRTFMVTMTGVTAVSGCQQPYVPVFRPSVHHTTAMVEVSPDTAPSVRAVDEWTDNVNAQRTQDVPRARVLAEIEQALGALCPRGESPRPDTIHLQCRNNPHLHFRLGADGVHPQLERAFRALAVRFRHMGTSTADLVLSVTLAGGADRLRPSRNNLVWLASHCRGVAPRALAGESPCVEILDGRSPAQLLTLPLTSQQRDAANNVLAWRRASEIGAAFDRELRPVLPPGSISVAAYGVGTSFQSVGVGGAADPRDRDARRVDIVITARLPPTTAARVCPAPGEALTAASTLHCFQEANQYLQARTAPSLLPSPPGGVLPESAEHCIVFEPATAPGQREDVNRVLREEFQIQDANRCHATLPLN